MKNNNFFASILVAISCVCLPGCYRDSVDDPTKGNGDSTKDQIVIGEFSVSAYQKVMFSKGNLQYQASTDTWRFAPHQYDYVGANSGASGSIWVDQFCWGDTFDYSGNWTDWGENAIGGMLPNTYRTLSAEEWDYLFYLRFNADQLWSQGTVSGVHGLIVLPDNFSKHLSVSWMAQAKNYENNTYSINEWTIMENGGAIFLPASDDNKCGDYWSSTPAKVINTWFDGLKDHDVYGTCYLGFTKETLSTKRYTRLDDNCSVRLVKDLE